MTLLSLPLLSQLSLLFQISNVTCVFLLQFILLFVIHADDNHQTVSGGDPWWYRRQPKIPNSDDGHLHARFCDPHDHWRRIVLQRWSHDLQETVQGRGFLHNCFHVRCFYVCSLRSSPSLHFASYLDPQAKEKASHPAACRTDLRDGRNDRCRSVA